MASSEGNEPVLLQDKLKDQVSLSIKESLEKATAILSNLYRVHSYLEVLKELNLSHSGTAPGSEGVKNALEQIQGIRNDTATLLQSIYLTEIGLQSLQDVHIKPSATGSSLTSAVPLLTDPLNISPLSGRQSHQSLPHASSSSSSANSNNSSTAGSSTGVVATATPHGHHHHDDHTSGVMVVAVDVPGDVTGFEAPPPSKKLHLSVNSVNIVCCSQCKKKFATQKSVGTSPLLCKSCTSLHQTAVGPGSKTPLSSLSLNSSSPSSKQQHAQFLSDGASPSSTSVVYSSTPATKQLKKGAGSSGTGGGGGGGGGKVSRRGNLPPLTCRICGIKFLYRRCLLRHLKETHSSMDLDLNNLYKYIEVGEIPTPSPSASTTVVVGGGGGGGGGQDSSEVAMESSSLNVTIDSQEEDIILESIINGSSVDAERDAQQQSSLEISALEQDLPLAASSSSQYGSGMSEDGEIPKGGMGEEGGKPTSPRFMCKTCNKCFDRPYRLQRHMQVHNPDRMRISCQICDRSFTRLDTLENHMKCLHSNERPFKCMEPGCSKSFAVQSALFQHLKTHTDGKPYRCTECTDSFSLLNKYKHHMREAHPGAEELRCLDCFKVFTNPQVLEQHKLTEHRLECEVCGKMFAQLGYLQMHVQVHNGDSLFNCQYCTEGFGDEFSYKEHLKSHPQFVQAKRTYHCQVCEMTFQDSSELGAHYHSNEHQEKVDSFRINTSSILSTIEEPSVLIDEVAITTELEEDDEGAIQAFPTESEVYRVAVSNAAAAGEIAIETETDGKGDSEEG